MKYSNTWFLFPDLLVKMKLIKIFLHYRWGESFICTKIRICGCFNYWLKTHNNSSIFWRSSLTYTTRTFLFQKVLNELFPSCTNHYKRLSTVINFVLVISNYHRCTFWNVLRDDYGRYQMRSYCKPFTTWKLIVWPF